MMMAIAHLIEGLVLWLIGVPFLTDLWLLFSCRSCQRGASTLLEALENLKVALVGVAYCFFAAGSWILLCFTCPVHERLSGTGVFAGACGALALSQFAYRYFNKARKGIGSRF